MEIFRAEHIEKNFGTFRALDDVNIAVQEGSIYGLLGPNGAGKTTLIRIINQITGPDKGELFFMGQKLKASDVERFGYLPEERGLYRKMKVGEQALYLARLKGLSRAEALKKLKLWFEKFEIQAWWDKKVEELSKGMQQKVQFIVTVLHDPKLLIFDEPFSGFDPINQVLLRDEILNLQKKGSTIFFSTHNMASVEELCDHITLIHKSRAILSGEINAIRNTYRSNLYEIGFTGDPEKMKSALRPGTTLKELGTENNHHLARLQLSQNPSDNELLTSLLPVVHIESFREVLPSMNDIFIRVVENAHPNEF
ncbi:MAG: ATP-binding cassette domain-containing protein [Bacteroidales bacterium]